MPVSHKRRCVFVHIPKTGGTSIEHALGMRGWHGRENRRKMIGPVLTDDLKALDLSTNFLQHLTMSELRDLHPPGALETYVKFTVVRNPWDRMVSTYFRPDADLLAQARAQGVELEDLGFDDFVEASMHVEHAHLRPQDEYVTDASGRLIVDIVGRFETLETSFREVCDQLGIRKRLPVKYASPTRPSRDHRPHYTPRSRALVEERYARDIELFGYEF
jgi:hypothetical protein